LVKRARPLAKEYGNRMKGRVDAMASNPPLALVRDEAFLMAKG